MSLKPTEKNNMEMKIELQPMTVPNFVTQKGSVRSREEGFTEAPKYALKDMDTETLDKLCNQFRADVFAKANKTDPQVCKGVSSKQQKGK